MSSSTKPKPRRRRATENQPRNCFICSGCFPTSKSRKNGGGKLICQRFCTLASRYLRFRSKYLNPGVTLCQNNGEFGRFDDIVELCDACVFELRAFFETYNQLSLLQLRLNRKLKKIGYLMKMNMPLHQVTRPGPKSEKKIKSEEFKRRFLEQVTKLDKDFPQLRLERVNTTGFEFEPTPGNNLEYVANVVVKQEQMETEDDCDGAEPLTLNRFVDGDHNDEDHEQDYSAADEDDNHDDFFPNDDQGDNGNCLQNAAGNGDGIETPESLDHDLVTGSGRRPKNDTSRQCVYCGRQFSNRYTRMLHERIHTGERPYKCTMCDREFSHLTTWRSHSEAKHKGKADVIKPPPNIRVRNKNNWQTEIAKQRRLRGETYQACKRKELDPETGQMVIKSKVLRKGRQMGPPCKSKKCHASERRSCYEFSESQRKEIFDHFWKKLDNWDAKKRWIRELIQIVPVHRRTVHSAQSQRNSTFRYHLPLNGEMEQVCRKMFLKTLALNSKAVQNWIKKGGGSDNLEEVISNDNDKDNDQHQNAEEGGEDGDETIGENREVDGVTQTQTTLCKQEHE